MATDTPAAAIPALPSVDLKAHAADLFNIDAALTEEERAIAIPFVILLTTEFADIGECYVEAGSRRNSSRTGRPRSAGASLPEEYGCGTVQCGLRFIMQELERGDVGHSLI